MADKLTPQQELAATNRGGKLLVSAAAGSGKTKVLVERLMRYITDAHNPANINEFLIITYTKAAAAELRGKIAKELVSRIAEEPGNTHLQQQMQRLYLTKISTVHAFCTEILREYAYMLDIFGDFRVAEEAECIEMQSAVMEQLLEQAYETASNNPDFCAFVDSQGFGRDDRQIPKIIMQVYESARCHLNPDKWLQKCVDACNLSEISDASQLHWGKFLMDDLASTVDMHLDALCSCAELALQSDNMEKPAALLQDIISQLQSLRQKSKWDEVWKSGSIDFGRLTFSKKCTDMQLAEQIKAVRNACKKDIQKKLAKFSDSSSQVLSDMASTAAATRGLIALVRQFGQLYDKVKKSHRVLDFGDLEHKSLDLLLGRSRSGPTAIANEIGERYREVMVDEYQDSNGVQDAIFTALTQKRQNCFMVGDVKQSIYQFRLADPGIFLEKYNSYVPAEAAAPGQGRKVMLSSNFRSCGSVIESVNDVFAQCMSPKVGGLAYGEDERLYEGVPHIEMPEKEVEFYGIDIQEDTYLEESEFVAERICQLLDGKHMVRNGEELRPVTPDDIVILLRSPNSVGRDFQDALLSRGIRCALGAEGDLLQSEEISTLVSLLQIIDNPLQDIPLLAVLSSRIFAFTADELAAIRSECKDACFFEALKKSQLEKADDFLEVLSQLRYNARLTGVCELIDSIFAATKLDSIFSAMPDGETKSENLRSFCQIVAAFEASGKHDLGSLISYIQSLQERGLPAPTQQKASGAVTVMSIHKSKGLEFPVVFLCGLSKSFNRESAREQVLCHKELGLGLCCVDTKNRVRYPSVAKRAIAVKILEESLSEELRVLYVAMTRAKDRLIMTYASNSLESDVSDLALRMDISSPELMASGADCPGIWVLLCAMRRKEAGELFNLCGMTPKLQASSSQWEIHITQAKADAGYAEIQDEVVKEISVESGEKLKKSLSYRYPHINATQAPSKLTATQLKGRFKDQEAAEYTYGKTKSMQWRKPSFTGASVSATQYGTAVHNIMQYIRFDCCKDIHGVNAEISRLIDEGYISKEHGEMVDTAQIAALFATDIGRKMQNTEVLREFKFSILTDSSALTDDLLDEKILLQGVVDCAIIEDDGITVVDFKTDYVTEETVVSRAVNYRNQVRIYAEALERIYKKPVKERLIYFFRLNRFVK